MLEAVVVVLLLMLVALVACGARRFGGSLRALEASVASQGAYSSLTEDADQNSRVGRGETDRG